MINVCQHAYAYVKVEKCKLFSGGNGDFDVLRPLGIGGMRVLGMGVAKRNREQRTTTLPSCSLFAHNPPPLTQGRLYGGSKVSLRLGHARVLTTTRVVIHCAHAASLPRPTNGRSKPPYNEMGCCIADGSNAGRRGRRPLRKYFSVIFLGEKIHGGSKPPPYKREEQAPPLQRNKCLQE